MSVEIDGVRAEFTISIAEAPEDVKMSEKYVEIVCILFSSSKTGTPSAFSMTEILFLALLPLVAA